MNIAIPCTWEENYLQEIMIINNGDIQNKITEIYGSLKNSYIGSGHSSVSIQGRCNKKSYIEEFVDKLHKNGLEFNYTINTSCLGNREFDSRSKKRIIKELEWICSISDTVTVTIPYLIELVKKISNNKIKVAMSTIAGIDNVNLIHRYEELGADRIVLDISLNRDLNAIQNIRENTNVELELLVNDSCLKDCPYRRYHYNTGSHASGKKVFYLEYCVYKCLLKRMENPTEIIKSPWIRPEDVKLYEGSVDYIKLGGREKNLDWISKAVEAYAKGVFEGNVLDILTITSTNSHELGKIFIKKDFGLLLDSSCLNEYFSHFFNGNCKNDNCKQCGFCERFSTENLKYNADELNDFLVNYRKLGDWLFRAKGLNSFESCMGKIFFSHYVNNSFAWKKAKQIISKRGGKNENNTCKSKL